MQQSKNESLLTDLRFWMTLFLTGALLSYILLSYPG
jgi:hypothetical protein